MGGVFNVGAEPRRLSPAPWHSHDTTAKEGFSHPLRRAEGGRGLGLRGHAAVQCDPRSPSLSPLRPSCPCTSPQHTWPVTPELQLCSVCGTTARPSPRVCSKSWHLLSTEPPRTELPADVPLVTCISHLCTRASRGWLQTDY